jgi:hypothetical protein
MCAECRHMHYIRSQSSFGGFIYSFYLFRLIRFASLIRVAVLQIHIDRQGKEARQGKAKQSTASSSVE